MKVDRYFELPIQEAIDGAAKDVNDIVDSLNSRYADTELNYYRHQIRDLAQITRFLGALVTAHQATIATLLKKVEHLEDVLQGQLE